MGKMCLNNTFISFLELICSRLVQENPDFIIFRARNSKFHDFWIFEPVTKPQSQHYLSLETPGHLKQIKKLPWNICETDYFVNMGIDMFESLSISCFIKFCEDGDQEMMEIGKIKSTTSWICISYLSKPWNGHLPTFLFSSEGIPSTPHHSDSPCQSLFPETPCIYSYPFFIRRFTFFISQQSKKCYCQILSHLFLHP